MEALAIPNEILLFGSPCIALFSLFPLYLTLYKAKSYKASFFYMAIHAFVVHITSSFWLANFKDFAIFTLGASALGTALEAGLVGILFHILPEQYSKAFYLEQNMGMDKVYRIFGISMGNNVSGSIQMEDIYTNCRYHRHVGYFFYLCLFFCSPGRRLYTIL